MHQDIKTKWIEALRGGKYEQCRNRLRLGNRFCCLGVLCDVIAPDKWIEDSHNQALSMPHTEYTLDIGIDDPGLLSSMNDDGASFRDIADYIEQNL